MGTQSFKKHWASNNNGAKLLWLQFRGHPDKDKLVIGVNPKVVVFTFHNFLSAKLHKMSNKVPS